jgi:hypothetical protein
VETDPEICLTQPQEILVTDAQNVVIELDHQLKLQPLGVGQKNLNQSPSDIGKLKDWLNLLDIFSPIAEFLGRKPHTLPPNNGKLIRRLLASTSLTSLILDGVIALSQKALLSLDGLPSELNNLNFGVEMMKILFVIKKLWEFLMMSEAKFQELLTQEKKIGKLPEFNLLKR